MYVGPDNTIFWSDDDAGTSRYAYITAYRRDRCEADNRRLMQSLHDDLRCIRMLTGCTIIYCHAQLDGWRRPIYMMDLWRWRPIDALLQLSRKYGQHTLLYRGGVYDVATGRVIGHCITTFFKSKTEPTHPRLVYVGNDLYGSINTDVSIGTIDTLSAWSSGNVAPRDGNVD